MPFERNHVFLFSPIGYERASFHSFSITNYPNILITFAIDGMKITFHYCLKFYLFLKIYLFIWLCCVFFAALAFLYLCRAGATLWLLCTGFSLRWLLLFQTTGSRAHRLQQLQHMSSVAGAPGLESTGSVDVAHGLNWSAACEIFTDQGLNLCLWHWQAHSSSLSHQESP